MTQFKVLGRNYPRVDAYDKVTGRATYAADVYLPGMLACKLLPSSRSHARIVKIDTSRAAQLPGCPLRHHRRRLSRHKIRLRSPERPLHHADGSGELRWRAHCGRGG